MEYKELEDVYEFHRNMRRTPWEQLFPHWFDTSDALLKAIGDEVERVKAASIFTLLNAGIKPPVLLWQESIVHKKYNKTFTISQLPQSVSIQAPLYKTWGKITLNNNTTKDIDGLQIQLNETHGIVINQLISQADKLVIDLTNNKVLLNNKKIEPQKIGEGIPYFATSANNDEYDDKTALHNEVVRITVSSFNEDVEECDIEMEVEMDNAVFTNEQNIEVTGLEAVPIDRIELYAEYDFPFNKQYNGWHKVYEKKYEKNTNVVYDMITTQFYTKNFYVHVWFKTLQYPYEVGFPCYKNAEKDSMYRVNEGLDIWGEQLGLPRREYKTNIPEKEYKNTYPVYYPFDIEQDYWYYRRLTHEYAWNEMPINDVDIKDTEGNDVIRLYSINPFIEDFVVHAKSNYPKDNVFTNCCKYKPTTVQQKHNEGSGRQTDFENIINLLLDENKYTSIILNNYTDNNDVIYKRIKYNEAQKQRVLTQQEIQNIETNAPNSIHWHNETMSDKIKTDINYISHQSAELITYFDLSNLPSNINIDNIEIEVEAESTDNKKNKYSTELTGISIPDYQDEKEFFIPFVADKDYQLKKQVINYANNQLSDELRNIEITDESIEQEFTIGTFKEQIQEFVKIPFELYENGELVDDITKIWIYYNDNIRQASYQEENGVKYIYAYVPNIATMTEITIVCKSETHKPFTHTFSIRKANQYTEDGNDVEYQYIEGPLVDGVKEEIQQNVKWHTKDIRNLIQRQGIYFHNIIKNIDEQSTTTIRIYNVKLKVCYSQKQSQFRLKTHIHKKDIEPPYIGKYILNLTNTGDKPLKTHVDIITPPNIKMETNSIDIDLDIGKSIPQTEINILPSYPIDDGFYDILTVCEDQVRKDIIEVVSDGLIQTGIRITPQHAKYGEIIPLKAEVYALDGSKINGKINRVQFYINGFTVGEPVTVYNNKATTEVNIQNKNFIGTGNLPLEARFLGTNKYASSRGKSTIFISKDDTRITLFANNVAPYLGSFELKAQVEYFNGEDYLPVDSGSVTFFINDEILSNNVTLTNGMFTAVIDKIENPPGEYTLNARYSGTDEYSATEISQPLEIIGGTTKTIIFDVQAKPYEEIQLKAHVTDSNNKNIIGGYIDFNIKDQNGNNIDFGIDNFSELISNIPVTDGLAVSPKFPVNIELASDLNTQIYFITGKYHYISEDDIQYQDSENEGYLTITKGKVSIEHQSVFYGTQYEPLGFYIKLKDEITGEPVTNGKVKITLKKEDTSIEEDVDENGVACLLHRPLEYVAKQWQELEKTSFDVVANDLHRYSEDDNPDLDLADFEYHNIDGTLHFLTNQSVQLDENKEIQYNSNDNKYYVADKSTHNLLEEYENLLYITDGHLYARTTQDSLRQYILGLQDVEIAYISNGQYANKIIDIKNGIDIKKADIDLDIHTYNLKYTDTDNIYCYVTEYSFEDGIINNKINNGKVEFIIDNQSFETVDVVNGKAMLDNQLLTYIPAGHHLITVKYVAPQSTQSINNVAYSYTNLPYSYSLLTLEKDAPQIDIRVSREVPKLYSDIFVDIINNNPKISLNGLVELYLDDTLIGSQYLNGNETMPGIVNDTVPTQLNTSSNVSTVKFNIIMPADIDIEGQHILKAVYEGNEFFLPAETIYELLSKPATVDIEVDDDIYIARGERCTIDINITCYDDIINEGQIILKHGDEDRAISNVLNNKTTLSWIPETDDIAYTLSYQNASRYKYDGEIPVAIHLIDALPEISIPNEHQTNIEEALMCLQPNGTITLLEDINVTKPIEINKNCTIIGENGSSIIKDVRDLVSTLEDIKMVPLSTWDIPPYKIEGLTLQNLNTTDFRIQSNDGINKELFFKSQSGYVQIYLADDGNFYSETKVKMSDILSEVNLTINEDVNVHFDNLTFKSNDSDSIVDFAIYNKGTCEITHSIIKSTTKVFNKGTLTAHRNLIYGNIQGDEADLDNNWWGTNTPLKDVNNHMIIKVYSVDTPAVISEEVSIVGEIIGANGQYYDIPQPSFSFLSDTGYFSIDAGVLTNNQIHTTFLDGEEECDIRFIVDNETVSCPIYSYERKTEVIIEDIEEVLINYQIPITAKVQSCADIYYEFDNNNQITKNTQTIDEGYMTFFIGDQQVGYQKVKEGEAKTLIFFKDTVYNLNKTYDLTVKFHSSDNYFDSTATIPIKVISEDGICFVSPSGSDDSSGSYHNPVATITKALSTNAPKIYLLNGDYTENKIIIKRNVTIKKYNGTVTFKDLQLTNDFLFSIWASNKIVNISGIDFINNTYKYIFRNDKGSLNIDKCIFYNNNATLFHNTDTDSPRLNVSRSVLIGSTVSTDIRPNHYSYCWFGSNLEDNPNNFNNYVIMTTKQSKDKIYIGTLAHVTGELTYYKNDDNIYKLDKKLPLRIAKFATDIGSAKPIKDFTYNNQSTSLINTLEANNTQQIILSLENNTFYDGHNVNIVVNVNDVHDNFVYKNNINDIIRISITGNGINIQENIKNNNGIATYNTKALPQGVYNIACEYDYDGRTYSLNTFFTVKPLDIIISNMNIDNGSHLYYININASVQDNFNNNISNEVLNIKIDNNIIKRVMISDGIIDETITYPLLTPGNHQLTIDNENIKTSYDLCTYTQSFNVRPQETQIDFDYDTFEINVSNNLIIEVYDEEGREVQHGTITAEIDNEEVDIIDINNGIGILKDIIFLEKGQHSIALYYTDVDGFYKDSILINSQIGAGIYPVIFGINETDIIKADIGKNLVIETTVQDVAHQNINSGHINIYIDDSLFLTNITVSNGHFSINHKLPDGIASDIHRLTIEYTGDPNYLDTQIHPSLNIGKIPTSIGIDRVIGASGQKATIDYTIDSAYGNVNVGVLTAYYNDEPIGASVVTDSIVNQITINTPLLPANNDYRILFKYHDDTNFSDSEKETVLTVRKSDVNIQPQKTWYYPQREFNFVIDVRDEDDKIIDEGVIELYIDNVKEYDDIKVINGQGIVPLFFNNARTYKLDIIFKENEYYLQSKPYEQIFNVTNIDIQNISFEYPLESLPNQIHSNKIIFDTPDYNIKDGIIDISFDNNLIKSYYVAENNKYVDFNIGNEVKGIHKLSVNYHGSSIFNDIQELTYDFTVLSKTIEMRINMGNMVSQDITAMSNDEINIVTSFGDIVDDEWVFTPMEGIVKYYIQVPKYRIDENNEDYIDGYDDVFIGLESIDNQNTITHKYILTDNLLQYAEDNLETHYRIKAHFVGNDEYDECFEYVNLRIIKQETNIILPADIYCEYQDVMNIDIQLVGNPSNINVVGKEPIDIYIDNTFIGSCDVIDGTGTFSYRLHSRYNIGQYTLRAVFNGSAINYPSSQETQLNITSFTPRLKTNTLQVPIGGKLELDNIIYDINGTVITTGQLIYHLNNEVILETTPGMPSIKDISPSYITDQTLTVEYISADQTKYNNFTKDITLEMIKNDVRLFIDAPEKVYRGTPFDIVVRGECNTTSIPIDLEFDKGTMTNGVLETSITYPVSTEDNSIIQEYIITDGNEYFNENQVLLSVHIQNKDIVTVDTTIPESSDNAHTLAKAIDLVNDYGIIQLNNSVSNETINQLSKNITIEGNNNTLTACSINNTDKKLTIKDTIFENNTETTINNNGILEIKGCEFNNNTGISIEGNGITSITETQFNNNNNICIKVSNKNYRTSITHCRFNENNVSLFNGCIYSDKVNNMEILYNEFSYNNQQNNSGSCIYAYGNINISSNAFFKNKGKSDINLLKGSFGIENNLFDGNTTSANRPSVSTQFTSESDIDADLNYWGYNDIDAIETRNPNIPINNYLIAQCEFYDKEDGSYIFGSINQYINRLETEIVTINTLDIPFPVSINNSIYDNDNNMYNINKEILVNDNDVIKIGQDEFQKE